jgi:predicted dinucleotide-binding enzyme
MGPTIFNVFVKFGIEVVLMNIGIIGSSNIGSGLEKTWARNSHGVTFSSHNPGKVKGMASSVSAKYGIPDQAARSGDVILWSCPGLRFPTLLRRWDLSGGRF